MDTKLFDFCFKLTGTREYFHVTNRNDLPYKKMFSVALSTFTKASITVDLALRILCCSRRERNRELGSNL